MVFSVLTGPGKIVIDQESISSYSKVKLAFNAPTIVGTKLPVNLHIERLLLRGVSILNAKCSKTLFLLENPQIEVVMDQDEE